MKKWIVLTLVLVFLFSLSGCKPEEKAFHLDRAARIELRSGLSGEVAEITDQTLLKHITDEFSLLKFEKKGTSDHYNGYVYMLKIFDELGNVIENISITHKDGSIISYEGRFYSVKSNKYIDMDFLAKLLEEDVAQRDVVTISRITYGEADTKAELLLTEKKQLLMIMESYGWLDEETNCESDCILTVGENLFYYHSVCGTVNDPENKCSLTLSEQDRVAMNQILGKYITLGDDILAMENWGIAFSAKNISNVGLTLVCTQLGGVVGGKLYTGSEYWIEQYKNGSWEKRSGADVNWTAIALIIPTSESMEWTLNWERMYGALPTGTYRAGKTIYYDVDGATFTQNHYAEFEIQ